jgi:hypothetical protein
MPKGLEMKMKPSIGILVAISLMISTTEAFAALGQDRASIAVDHRVLASNAEVVTEGPGYQIHEMQLAQGATVHQYVSPNGKVFAIKWSGQRPPNLEQVLGAYYNDYVQAARIHSAGHHLVQVKQDNVVITHVQYLRSYSGSAYVPALVPTGIDLNHLITNQN